MMRRFLSTDKIGGNMNLAFVKDFIRKATWVLILLVILYIIQHLVNYLSYDYSGPSGYIVNVTSHIGVEEEFARFILWDVFLILLTLICIKLFFKKSFQELGFNLHNYKSGIKYILVFLLVYPVIVTLSWFLIYQFAGASALIGRVQNQSVDYIVKDLLLYGLLPGIGEEPLFRIFVIQFLLITAYAGNDLGNKVTRFWIIIISAICFAYGHIFIVSWAPFKINYDVIQLFTAFALGIFYAITYIRTKSILVAVICHNYSDFIARLGLYVIHYIMQKL